MINAAHSDEDRTAAESLAEEIEAACGFKPKINTAHSMPGTGDIYLARVSDDKRLSAILEASGVAT